MDQKPIRQKRTIIDISNYQPEFDFDKAAHFASFMFPEYQRSLLRARFAADVIDIVIVAAIYSVFVTVTSFQMPEAPLADRRTLGAFVVGFLTLLGVYFLLFMLSASQTPGMKWRRLTVVDHTGHSLDPKTALMRGAGYFISIVPFMLGFIWALIDPEHLTWADKVSGTYLKKL